eukprot:1153119-Pelagomonas_calceolata.AAC.4
MLAAYCSDAKKFCELVRIEMFTLLGPYSPEGTWGTTLTPKRLPQSSGVFLIPHQSSPVSLSLQQYSSVFSSVPQSSLRYNLSPLCYNLEGLAQTSVHVTIARLKPDKHGAHSI